MEDVVLIKIGKCPICNKGEVVKGSIGYSCNYFKDLDDKCTFNIYHSYFGKEITDEIAKEIIEKGETGVYDDLKRKDGTSFSASLALIDNLIKPKFKNETISICPECGKDVEELSSGYACADFHRMKDDNTRTCSFFIPKNVSQKSISKEDAIKLIEKGETGFYDDFKTKEGKSFTAKLILKDDNQLAFSNNICKCPKCGGNIYAGTKAYNCSNWKDPENKCDFVIWKQMATRNISIDEVIQLCSSSTTDILHGFRNNEGEFSRKLIINADFKVIMI